MTDDPTLPSFDYASAELNALAAHFHAAGLTIVDEEGAPLAAERLLLIASGVDETRQAQLVSGLALRGFDAPLGMARGLTPEQVPVYGGRCHEGLSFVSSTLERQEHDPAYQGARPNRKQRRASASRARKGRAFPGRSTRP